VQQHPVHGEGLAGRWRCRVEAAARPLRQAHAAAVEEAVGDIAARDGVVLDAVVADVGEIEVAADKAVAERRDAVLDVVGSKTVHHVPVARHDPQGVAVVLVLDLLPGEGAGLPADDLAADDAQALGGWAGRLPVAGLAERQRVPRLGGVSGRDQAAKVIGAVADR
jgi:hypothetical protein